jgi:hypothetical protein
MTISLRAKIDQLMAILAMGALVGSRNRHRQSDDEGKKRNIN